MEVEPYNKDQRLRKQ